MQQRISLWLLGLVVVFGCGLFGGMIYYAFWNTKSPTALAIEKKLERENETLINFNLTDPDEAPEDIRNLAKFGYALMINTSKHAPKYAGNGKMACTNCHFAGGNTTGGKNGAISLAGVAATYPRYYKAEKKVVDLGARINNCFEKSMNGKPLPLDSREMLALETYLHWISKGVPIYEEVPWLGLPPIIMEKAPDGLKGQKDYNLYCAFCHGNSGEGRVGIPPLWGPDSFNQEAGLAKPEKFASFIFLNMPYTDASLSLEETWDITEFVLQQPRPGFDAH